MILTGLCDTTTVVKEKENDAICYYEGLSDKNNLTIKSDFCTEPCTKDNIYITDIKIIVPDKVTEITFSDDKKEKMVCDKEDKYNLRQCLFIAIAKHLYKKDYTQEGIEYKANEMKYLKKYVKIVDNALKNHHDKCESVKKLEENYKKELERVAKKRAKREERKSRREQKRKEEEIAIQREAYIQAMEYMNNKTN